MPQPARTFRLFVSSTFSDLKEERNALHRTVFPALRKLCEESGCRFQAIDLRWGVREEAGLDQQTMRICLDEVKRCQDVTPRPNFLILLGQRYGWRPLPAEIPADEWQKIDQRLTAQGAEGTQHLDKLKQWYQLDLNAHPNAKPPGLWLLKPRTDPPYNDFKVWEREVERPLREILLGATAGLNLPEDAHLKYWASATEQEIDRGALRVKDAKEHVFCFFRTITGLPEDGTAEGFRDLTPGGVPDREADELLEKLKGPRRQPAGRREGKLPKALPDANFSHYQSKWVLSAGQRPAEGQSPIALDHLGEFCQDVERVLSEVIRAQIAKLKQEDEERKATDLDKEIEQHEAFCKDRTKFFRGREATLRKIADYLAADDPRPLALIGGPGSGKSAVLAKAIEEARTAHPDAAVVFRFIGWTPGSGQVRDLLDKLCREIGPADQPTPSEYRELVQEFPKRLKAAGENRRLIVFLDALDQLSEADNARNLIWLPMELPANVRLVVSTSTEPGDTESVLKRRLPEECRFPLDDMPVEDAHDLLGMWFKDVNRTLQGQAERIPDCREQWKSVLDRYSGCKRPLYLKLAFEEARRWRSFDDAKDNQLAPDISSLIEQLYVRLSLPANHGATIVSRSLGYLAAGKNGLTEDEMIDVLSRDHEVLDEVQRFHQPPEEKLPVVIWSRLYFDLEPYLTQRSADDTTLLAFYHRQLDLVARTKYLEPFKTARHRTLAEFFGDEKQQLFLGEGEAKRANIRKLSELPYQQTSAGERTNPNDEMWAKLYATLTDFEFLEAKCTYVAVTSEGAGETARKVYNGVYELQEDYRRALDMFPAG